jgi:signal transduction histidine kinase
MWFAFSGGLGYIDPARIVHNSVPPPVTIMAINASGREYSPYSNELRLPVGTTQLRIGYTANSLSVPQRVRFRYRLEGLDRGWQDVGDRREAIYTNVAPGTYRFRVIAANNDGVWNNTGATRTFTILPAFYQTGWFYALCLLAGAALLFLLFWLRVRQVTAAVRARLEQRIVERERIARDLHDTLLQGLQGLILRFQAVGARIPSHERAREMMEHALTRADEVLIESRDRVKDLRSSSQMQSDLSSLLSAAGQQLAQEHPAAFSVAVEGDARSLHPILKEEALMIGREALSNAFRHAAARRVELEIAFGSIELRLRVRDDGRGLDSEVLESGGRPGHWGLRGMHERAKEIRAQLDVWSRPGLGTEVQLRIPASIAYRPRRQPRRLSWLSRRASGSTHD